MWLFAVNGVLYVSYNVLSGEWRYLAPFGTPRRPVRKFKRSQQWAYSGILLMGAGSLLTGLAIYKPAQLSWLAAALGGYPSARFLHFWLTVGYVLFFFAHIVQVARSGWNHFQTMITGHEL
jgi:thiosulfate reductase cytochrome b subunit